MAVVPDREHAGLAPSAHADLAASAHADLSASAHADLSASAHADLSTSAHADLSSPTAPPVEQPPTPADAAPDSPKGRIAPGTHPLERQRLALQEAASPECDLLSIQALIWLFRAYNAASAAHADELR